MNRTEVVRRGFLCSVVVAGFSIPISEQVKAQTGELARVQVRITQAIDELQRLTLFGNVHPLAVGKYDRGPAALSMPASRPKY